MYEMHLVRSNVVLFDILKLASAYFGFQDVDELITQRKRAFLAAFNANDHARRSLSAVGETHSGQSTPPTTVLLSFTFILCPTPLPPERCKVSQQVWNRVMN